LVDWSRGDIVQRILRATIHTLNGLRAVIASEAAFRQELAVLIAAIPLAFLIATDNWKRLLLVALIVFVMVVELLNTALEKLADRVTLEHDPVIGRVKDMGSAAVGLSLLLAGLFWLLAIWERIAAFL
jgi:diacylglycerol kinase (ATP)